MNRIDSTARSPTSDRTALASVLRLWLLAGLALCLLLPPLRGSSYWLGWLPLWLVVTPLVGALAMARDPWAEARALARVWLPARPIPVQARRTRRASR